MLILHSADWHIQDSRIEECHKVLNALRDWAESNLPDLILLAGDLTHRYDVKLGSQTARLLITVIQRLMDIAPVAIVGGTPFHDGQIPEILREIPENESGLFIALNYPEQIMLLDECLYVLPEKDVPYPDAIISLVPAPTKKFIQNWGNIADTDDQVASGISAVLGGFGAKAREFPTIPHIVAGHWSVGGAYISEHQMMIGRDIEVSRDQIALANADLVCLGHIHKAQSIMDNTFYSGSTYSIDAGELDDKGFWWHNIDEAKGRTSEFVKLPATKRLVVKADFTEDDSGLAELDAVLYTYSAEEIAGNLVKVSFRAYRDDAEKLVPKEIEDFFLSAGAKEVKIEIIRVPRDNVRCAEYFKAETLREKLIQQAEIRGKPDNFEAILAKADILESTDPEKMLGELLKL